MTDTTDTRVTCFGSVTGWCGTRHRTDETAEACQARHQRGCKSAGGYSDRRTYPISDMSERIDGSLYR